MTPKDKNYKMPAEWEKHKCCWMQWPHNNPNFNSYAEVPSWSHFDIEKGRIAWANVANAISNFEPVNNLYIFSLCGSYSRTKGLIGQKG